MLQLSQTALSDQLQIGHASHPGRSGKNNEDYYGVFSVATSGGECVVAAVADGIGGSVGGEQASRLTIRTIADFLEDNRYLATSPGQRLDQAIRLANRAVYDKAQSEPALLGMGTTIVAVALDGDRLYVVHAGDSRAYLVRGGRAQQLTLDHSWAQEAIEAGRITPEAAKTHPNRHVIRRYLGINEEVETDPRVVDPGQGAATGGRAATVISPILTQVGDAIVLCTDGLTDEVGDEEIAKIVSRHSPEEAARRLVDAANAAGGADNITVVVLQRGKGGGAAGAGGRSPLVALGLAAMGVLLVGALGWLLASGTLFGGPAKGAANGEVAAIATAATANMSAAIAQPDTPAPTDTPTDVPPTATATLLPVDTAEPTEQAAAGGTVVSAVGSEPVTGTVATTTTPPATAPEVTTEGTRVPETAGGTEVGHAQEAATPPTSTPASRPGMGNGGAPAEDSSVIEGGTPIVVEATLDPALAPTATPVAAVTKEPTATRGTNVAPTSTPAHRGTPTFTVTPTEIHSTPVPAPNVQLAATRMPTHTPAFAEAATGSNSFAVTQASGPHSIEILTPNDLASLANGSSTDFEWQADEVLQANQVYELVFWRAGIGTPDSGQAVTSASRNNKVTVKADQLAPGDYQWGVFLAQEHPYTRIRYLGQGHSVRVSGSGSDKKDEKANEPATK